MLTILKNIHIKASHLIQLVILTIVYALAEMMIPTLLAVMIDKGIASNNQTAIIKIAAVMLSMAIIAFVSNSIVIKVSTKIATRFGADLRRFIFDKVQHFSTAELDKFGTASLVTRSTSDVANVQLFLTLTLRIAIMAPLMAVAGLVLSSATGGKIGAVLNVSIPVLLICTGAIIVFSSRASKKLRKIIDKLNQLFLETLEGARVIRAFNKQTTEINRFADENDRYTKLSIVYNKLTGSIMPVIQVIFGVTITAVMGLGSYYVSVGDMEIGALVANTQYISMILFAVVLLTIVIVMFPMSYACAKRIEEVMQTEASIVDPEKPVDISSKEEAGTIVFDNVSFQYPGADEAVLENISFAAKKGEMVAIIGRTGCGKSSILKLIPRFYDASVGHVYVDGIDVRKFRIKELRDIIGYVPQKNVLFTGDIASNLNFGKEDGTQADWEEATKLACADEFVTQKEDTYHSAIAQGGTNLSGGQRQRMAIARAMMKKPEIYIFDDSLSALDMKTDKTLRENIKNYLGDSTVIMVAQRVSSIVDADRILVLENGKIIGNGKHDELLQNCKLYREIATLQLGEEAVKNA